MFLAEIASNMYLFPCILAYAMLDFNVLYVPGYEAFIGLLPFSCHLLTDRAVGMNFLFDDNGTLPLTAVNRLPFNPLKMDPDVRDRMIQNGEGVQFSHSLEEEIGGQLQAGFLLKALY